MAIKIFCDLCEEEIKQDVDASMFKFTAPVMNKEDVGKPNYMQKEETYCGKCTNEIKKTVEKLRK